MTNLFRASACCNRSGLNPAWSASSPVGEDLGADVGEPLCTPSPATLSTRITPSSSKISTLRRGNTTD